ncbi:MAG: DUF411 domain-containing protein [Acidiferrobacterales bacterium]
MRQALSVIGLILLVAVSVGCTRGPADATEVVVYKSATCGCCKDWIRHLEANGFAVKAHDVSDLAALKRQNGVSRRLASCHTARIGDYVIEGHVPAQDIKRLLAAKPNVKGLAVPGMPVGSPGMEVGARKDRYNVYTFDKAGRTTVYRSY